MRDYDAATHEAWQRFTDRLATCLNDDLLNDGEITLMRVGDDDQPLMRFYRYDTVIGAAVPTYGAGPLVTGRSGVERRAFLALGWNEGVDEYSYTVDPADSHDLAATAASALRTVLGVEHPALIEVEGAEAAVTALTVPAPDPAVPDPATVDAPPPIEEPFAVEVRNREHLQELIEAALAVSFGHDPSKDEDGDIPVRNAGARVYVRAAKHDPSVDLFGAVVLDVGDVELAERELNILNRDTRYVTFVLRDDTVWARLQLPSSTFVPSHLRDMLALMLEVVADATGDLVRRVGGRRAVKLLGPEALERAQRERETHAAESYEPVVEQPAESEAVRAVGDDDDLPSELQALLELDAYGEGTLDADLAASVCHHDLELILSFIRESEEQSIAWRKAVDEALEHGDEEEAAACDGEAAGWEATTKLLRGALAVVVEEEARRKRRPPRNHEPADG